MDSLDLLKSLTKGVNKKINQEHESSVEYIVDTSLRNKNRKSAPPVIKEVSVKADTPSNEEVYYEDIVEEGVVSNTEQEQYVEENVEEFFDSSLVEEDVLVEETLIEETFIEDTVSEIVNENSVETDLSIEETSEVKENGHILEELPINKKEVHRIQRNGNPFKRGPRKKKTVEQPKVEENSIVPIEEKVEEIIEPVEPVEPQIEIEEVSEPILEVVNEADEIDFSEDLTPIGEIDFASIFGDISEEDDVETVQTEVIEKEPLDTVEEDFEEIEGVASIIDTVEIEEPIAEIKDEPIAEIEDESIVEIEPEVSIEEEPKLTEVVEEEVEDVTPIVTPSVVETEEVSSEDEKFKNCIYYKGMPVEEFLRANSDYRETLFVEHFYKKEELQELLVEGKILIKKGKYRL